MAKPTKTTTKTVVAAKRAATAEVENGVTQTMTPPKPKRAVRPRAAKPAAATKPTAVTKAAPVKTGVPRKKAPRAKTSNGFTQDDVALRAYFIAEKRQAEGREGNPHTDWLEAERQLRVEHGMVKA